MFGRTFNKTATKYLEKYETYKYKVKLKQHDIKDFKSKLKYLPSF